jgi:polyisoprenyl-phosphate glycosyltransferase
LSKTASRIDQRNAPRPGWVEQIPTEDAQAALRFCRALARQVENAAGGSEQEGFLNPQTNVAAHRESIPELSVVIPIYNEAENIAVLYDRLVGVLESVASSSFEIVFVDDGSKDESANKLNELAAADERVTVLELARNFGHQLAITAGLDFARGRAVAVMDADLQDPPEVLPEFIDKWREGNEVVYAIRAKRKEGWIKRTGYKIFYRLLRHVANIDIPLDAGDFCIMDRSVVDSLKSMPERNRFVRGIRSWVGFKQVGIPFERDARHAGKSKYTFFALMLLALDGLVAFSYMPLRIITFLGFTVSLMSISLAIYYTAIKLQLGLNPPGFATIVVAICFFSGVQLITLGVIGEYVGRIFEEAKRRPMYVLRRASRAE